MRRKIQLKKRCTGLSQEINHINSFMSFDTNWAAIQKRGSILTWIVILSVYGADTIAEVKLQISPFLR